MSTTTEEEDETAARGSSPPFRIRKVMVKGRTHTVRRRPNRSKDTNETMYFGSGRDRWVATRAPDFNTVTFGEVVRLFKHAISHPSQTALVVNRLICNVSTPSEFQFSKNALRVLMEENAGGSSEFSEALSCELFERLFHSSLVKTEMAVEYEWGDWSKKTDYTTRLNGKIYAVSVTRAMKFRGIFTETDGFTLLYKKLYGIQIANRDVVERDRWEKSILHIMTEHVYIVDILRSVYAWMYERSPEMIGNTVVLITLTVNTPFVYVNCCQESPSTAFVTGPPTRTLTDSTVTFTTPALKHTTQAPCFIDEASCDKHAEDFWYGYATREEALEHNAIPIIESVKDELGELAEIGEYGEYDDQDDDDEGFMPYPLEELSKLQRLNSSSLSISAASTMEKPLDGCYLSDADSNCDDLSCCPVHPDDAAIQLKLKSLLSAAGADPSIPATNSCSSTSSLEELQTLFPPIRENLLDLFKRTFVPSSHVQRDHDQTMAGTMDEMMREAKLSLSHRAIIKHQSEYTQWSYSAELKGASSSSSKAAAAVDGEFLGLVNMFDDA